MLIRVFELPKTFSSQFLFQNAVNQTFREVDWFQYSDENCDWDKFYNELSKFIKQKIYYNPEKSYLIMSQKYAFTINYNG